MTHRFLEVTFRDGKPLAAYLYLERRKGDTAARSEPRGNGYVVDFASDGRAITAPAHFTLAGLNALLAELRQPPVSADEARPLAA